MRKQNTTKTVGYVYVGRWSDETLGWIIPKHVYGWGKNLPSIPKLSEMGEWARDAELVKCKITLEVVKGKNGKPIKRRIK